MKDDENRTRAGNATTRVLHGVIWNRKLERKLKKKNDLVKSIYLIRWRNVVLIDVRSKIRTVELDFTRRRLQVTTRKD